MFIVLLFINKNCLQTVLSIAKKILTSDVLGFVDSLALEYHISGESKTFCYRSFSEILNLVIASLLRELLQYQQGNSILKIYYFILYF